MYERGAYHVTARKQLREIGEFPQVGIAMRMKHKLMLEPFRSLNILKPIWDDEFEKFVCRICSTYC